MQMFLAGISGSALLLASVALTSSFGHFPNFFGKNSGGENNVTLNWRAEVTSRKCDPPIVRHNDRFHGTRPLINVNQLIKNDVDSGVGGNYWAYDNFSRHIEVWETATSTFCAVVTYLGTFNGIAGEITPAGGTTTLSGAEKGSIAGGYRATITGTLLDEPLWPTKGSVGVTDYQCDTSGNCPGYVDWTKQYFDTGVNQSLDWWGWIYHGGRFGTWVNAVSGNLGNIMTPPSPPKHWFGWGHWFGRGQSDNGDDN